MHMNYMTSQRTSKVIKWGSEFYLAYAHCETRFDLPIKNLAKNLNIYCILGSGQKSFELPILQTVRLWDSVPIPESRWNVDSRSPQSVASVGINFGYHSTYPNSKMNRHWINYYQIMNRDIDRFLANHTVTSQILRTSSCNTWRKRMFESWNDTPRYT